ncbi:MAG: 50S ribosomal protein L19 [Parcubacteria group bacterium]|nr:50S ribosomal protein L19 [Parcubacteria group bacterium]
MTTIVFSPVNIAERKKIDIRSGDTVRVWVKLKEGDKIRLQAFEGLVIARKHGTESGATFSVRKIASGVGVEKIFPLYSPTIDKIEILGRAKTRRAKLYYVREKTAKDTRRKMKRFSGFAPIKYQEMVPKEVMIDAAPEATPVAEVKAEAPKEKKSAKAE